MTTNFQTLAAAQNARELDELLDKMRAFSVDDQGVRVCDCSICRDRQKSKGKNKPRGVARTQILTSRDITETEEDKYLNMLPDGVLQAMRDLRVKELQKQDYLLTRQAMEQQVLEETNPRRARLRRKLQAKASPEELTPLLAKKQTVK